MHILYADDEPSLQTLMKQQLEKLGHSVVICPDGLTAVAALEREPFDCLIVDLDMPGLNGSEVIQRARQIRPQIEAVVMTGKPDLPSALNAIEHHVFAYLTKPCSFKEIKQLLSQVHRRLSFCRRLAALEHRVRQAEGDSVLVGNGAAMDRVRRVIEKVAPTDSTVLIRGETGCGKELVARAVQQASLRADEPMVSINCGALPENLIESELFGHVKGAFTGADSARVGLFEVADGGTIFLDEIGELPITMQAKLLRVLETGDIRRLGSNQSKRVDVRVICATHRDLEKMVQEEQFREDLMFRINTFEIHVPALRERTDDILPLAKHLLRRHRNDGTDDALFTPAAESELLAHKWPGNVRELANVIEHAAILCDALPIDAEHLPRHFSRRQLRHEVRDSGPMTIKQLELIAIERALERNGGDKKAAAEELGVSVKTLYNKLNSADEKAA
ncbi:sigma-54-dependent Fis family transcriptional regulator [Roseiconus nitratireducens]|uniref:Sigma-54-dependent Fis family transcriptional regulator n=1 Tax=Roseiconus nitratireducens TaxID=2605748 RepID=A0A5M6DIX5_9BACT|nr:sigma-54 dependent transcriptional regulator [Roseiconus nitratireducens]KAA5546316.1 sigma-54-dependent Fis family transcriptional regulator [Roseiconus nitratireducens]